MHTKLLTAIFALVFAFALNTATPTNVYAQGKPSWAGKKDEKGSRMEDAKNWAKEHGKGKKKGLLKEKRKKGKKRKGHGRKKDKE